jgi:AraC-like DNA-binding protein
MLMKLDKGALCLIRQKVFRKSLIIVLLITSIPTALVGSATYSIGRSQIEAEVKRTHTILLEKSAARIEEQLARIELTSTQWTMDPLFESARMLNLNLKRDYTEINGLYQSLMVMRNTNPLIEKIEIYMAEPSATINDSAGIVYLDERQNQYLKFLMEGNGSLFWVDDYSGQPDKKGNTIALFHDLPGTYGNTYGALIVHINSRAFKKMVDDMNADGDSGASFIMRRDGTIVTTGISGMKTLTEKSLAERVKSSQGLEALQIRDEGQTYSVSMRTFVRTNLYWNYVTATSMEKLTKPIDIMSRLILGISASGLLMAAFLSWLASYRLYLPIRRLLRLISMKDMAAEADEARDEIGAIEHHWRYLSRESQVLQEKLERNLPALKEAFLLQLLQGHLIHFTEDDIHRRMEHFDWDCSECQFLLAVIQIRGFSQNISSFTEGDEPLAAFAALNIVEEMTARCQGRIGVVNFHDMTVGILFAYRLSIPPEKIKSEFLSVINECVNGLGALLKLHVTATVGKRTRSVKELHHAYQSAKQSLQYRDLHKPNQILDMEELLPRKEAEFQYPFDVEKEALQAIRMGVLQESMELTDRFYAELLRCSDNEQGVRDGMHQFLGSIHHTIMESGYNPRTLENGTSAFGLLSNTKDTIKFPLLLKEHIIRPHCERMMKDRDIHLKQLVDGVITFLNAGPSKDISLELCAEKAGTTPYTLSRAFKQVVGANFIDYVTDLKLEQAKKLLLETDLRIHEIADRVGYQPSYLIRQFKKSTGVTPGQYRELHT